jgi:putative sterol carrier protein
MIMSNVSGIFKAMGERFDADAASGVEEIFQFDIDDAMWHAVIADGKCEIVEAEHDDPSVTLTMDADTFQEVMTGETDGMQAFMAGRIKADGNMMLATQLASLFPDA